MSWSGDGGTGPCGNSGHNERLSGPGRPASRPRSTARRSPTPRSSRQRLRRPTRSRSIMRTHGWGGSRETTRDRLRPAAPRQRLRRPHLGLARLRRVGRHGRDRLTRLRGPRRLGADRRPASRPRASPRRKGDPLIGMSGGSYAGGIQWVTDARDSRVDAIAPEISWNNLLESPLSGDGREDRLGHASLRRRANSRHRWRHRRPDRPGDRQLRPGDPPGVRRGRRHRHLVSSRRRTSSPTAGPTTSSATSPRPRSSSRARSTRCSRSRRRRTTTRRSRPAPAPAAQDGVVLLRPRHLRSVRPGPAGYIEGQIVKWFDRYVKGSEGRHGLEVRVRHRRRRLARRGRLPGARRRPTAARPAAAPSRSTADRRPPACCPAPTRPPASRSRCRASPAR